MNVLLWIAQALTALFCIAGSMWRISNYAEASKQVASVGALPHGTWIGLGTFEILASLGMILPGILKALPGSLSPAAAALLCLEMLLVSALHLKYFGLQFQATNPAMWTLALALLSAFIAYGRKSLSPF